MSAPQMKERPASMLRAMFAGFGSLMSVMDKVRGKPAAEAPSDAEASAPATTPAPEDTATGVAETAAPETVVAETVVAETVVEPEVSTGPETVVAETVVVEAVAPEPVAPEATAASEATAAPETAAPETVTPETVTPETVAAEVSTGPETVAAEIPAVAEPSGELPLANYEELSVASLRARLRNLSNDDLTLLMTYERAHQDRPEVIKMFQNRLIKMTTGMPKLEA
jgi:hypothetical protein